MCWWNFSSITAENWTFWCMAVVYVCGMISDAKCWIENRQAKFSKDMTLQWIELEKYQDKMQVARSQDKWKFPRCTASGGIFKFIEQFMENKVHNSQTQARKPQNKEKQSR